jgi:uncharacterized protein (TIGR03083 family)
MTERAWLRDATTRMLEVVDRLHDGDITASLLLPGWTVGHVVAHLHFNAEAIGRLVTWARTGTETPMYASMTQRTSDIEAGSERKPADLRRLLHESCRQLDESFDALTPAMWQNNVVTAQGRTVPATELVWMRLREVAVHGIDLVTSLDTGLGTGLTFADLPGEAVAKLVHEIVTKRLTAGEGPALAAWLTGRVHGGPPLGPWL